MLRVNEDGPTFSADQGGAAEPLPADVRDRLGAALGDRAVADWSRFDLDSGGRFVDGAAVLTDSALLVLRGEEVETVRLDALREVEIAEGLGVDGVQLVGEGGHVLGELRFSGRRKRAMHRLGRRLQRLMERRAHPDDRTAVWMERAERAAAVADDADDEEKPQDRRVLLRLLGVARPYRGHVVAAAVFTVVSAGFHVFSSFLTKPIIDNAINPQTTVGMTASERGWTLLFWAGVYAASLLVMLVTFWLRMRNLCFVGSRIAGDLRDQTYRHLHTLSMRYFGKHRTGSLITRVTSDTDRLWDFVVFGSVELLKVFVFFTAAAGFMLWTNWRLALIAMAPLPLVAGLAWWKTVVMTRIFGRLWTYWGRLTAVVGDAVPGVKVIKAFAAEGREVEKFARRNAEFVEDEYAAVRTWADMQPVVEGTMLVSRVLILVFGGWFIITDAGGNGGANTLGTLVMFLGIMSFFHMAIMEVVQKQRMVTRAATSAQRVFEVLDTPPDIVSKPGAVVPERIDGAVEFRDVSFSYDGAKPALREINLRVEPGMMVGLCGSSGAGKSTFVNLVSRFFDVSDGQILLDGRDLRDLNLAWLRGHVGVVLQEPYLFYGTIADNIRYGSPEASDEQVIAAARAANAHGFITNLPDGYDTTVGERGQSLSGGERQRVSIARAILHNPKVLVLDEATSSVDSETERQIQEALDRLVEGRTTFAIAHRLSTIKGADLIAVFDKGRLVATGTHEELLDDSDGIYANLVRTQFELATEGLADESAKRELSTV